MGGTSFTRREDFDFVSPKCPILAGLVLQGRVSRFPIPSFPSVPATRCACPRLPIRPLLTTHYSLPATHRSLLTTARPRKTAVEPPNSTIPCKTLYLPVLPLLSFHMFRPRLPFSTQLLPVFAEAPHHSSVNCLPNLQSFQHSNLSIHAYANPFTIRTYVKRALNSFGIRTYKTQDLKPFRIRTYKKTGRGEAIVDQHGTSVPSFPVLCLTYHHGPQFSAHAFSAWLCERRLPQPGRGVSALFPSAFGLSALSSAEHAPTGTPLANVLSSVCGRNSQCHTSTPIPSFRKEQSNNGRAPRTRWTHTTGRRSRPR